LALTNYASQASEDADGMDRTNPMTGEAEQAQFAALNGCTAEPNVINFPAAGQPHVCTIYKNCSAGHPIPVLPPAIVLPPAEFVPPVSVTGRLDPAEPPTAGAPPAFAEPSVPGEIPGMLRDQPAPASPTRRLRRKNEERLVLAIGAVPRTGRDTNLSHSQSGLTRSAVGRT
jgi:hypothetical protein